MINMIRRDLKENVEIVLEELSTMLPSAETGRCEDNEGKRSGGRSTERRERNMYMWIA